MKIKFTVSGVQIEGRLIILIIPQQNIPNLITFQYHAEASERP
jgi:hypothetical protein